MTQAAANWAKLPQELRERAQWLIALPDAKGALKVPHSVNASTGELIPGSSTGRETWLPFDTAARIAASKGYAIGYVLSFDDPFSCIDLDVKNAANEPDKSKWTPDDRIELYTRIVGGFDSYTERSISGIGLHIWVRGKIGAGCKRDGVEVYSQERFIVCTGDAYIEKPIYDRQIMLTNTVSLMRPAHQQRQQGLEEIEEEDSDSTIYERARHAGNADKFNSLVAGKWEESGEYPSQSEADLALMSMFTFYSRSNEQCRRLFRATALGKRAKAQKDNRYLDFTLRVIRSRQTNEDRLVKQAEFSTVSLQLTAKEREEKLALQAVYDIEAGKPAGMNGHAVLPDNVPPATQQPTHTLPQPPAQAPGGHGLAWPPGLAGAIAGFVYRNAPRPVKEVAIVAALGWLAGVCGKAYMIPQSGLNLYIILVARSGIGKESMHSGLSTLTQCLLEKGFLTASRYVDFGDFVSGPALRKAVASNPSFLNVNGEWGRKLRRLSADSTHDGPMQSLRTEMTNLYQKSGPQAIVGGLSYSKRDEHVGAVSGVAYSMIGETTPGTFYDALTESMMEDGFLSRFTVVEYAGDRPAMNNAPQRIPEEALLVACGELCNQATLMIERKAPMQVMRTPEAAQLMDQFDRMCDVEINKTLDESWRQMWNRAHLKAMRIAALLAAADGNLSPMIQDYHIAWAIDLIKRDIKIMQRRVEEGDIGSGDSTRERKLLTFCRDYLTHVPQGYQIPEAMHGDGVVPRKYFQMRTAKLNAFVTAKNGAIRALDETIRSLVDSGYLMEVDRVKVMDSYGFQGRCYRIVSLPGGLLE
jgi:hypothetical protein